MRISLVILSLLLCGVTSQTFAQSNKSSAAERWSGTWTGYLTQEEGGYKPKYFFELKLRYDGQLVIGTSYVSIDDIYAEYEIFGEIKGDVLSFKEIKMVRYTRLDGLEWCLKWGTLRLKQKGSLFILEGVWGGKSISGPCVPGKLFLQKEVPRV
ncbi:MAG: hypothetical protein H6555_01650 [Lewinellaceae bacterium]|nr:hypothetical protein [Lewinellaceae bacterium]